MTKRTQELLIQLNTMVESSKITAAFDTTIAFGDDPNFAMQKYNKDAHKISGDLFEQKCSFPKQYTR